MAWAKHSFVANLKITPDELRQLKRLLKLSRPAVGALDAVVNSTAVASILEGVPQFAEIEWQLLVSVAETLAKLREEDLKQFRDTYATIFAAMRRGEVIRAGLGAGRSRKGNPERQSK
jgi:hypothetical protein